MFHCIFFLILMYPETYAVEECDVTRCIAGVKSFILDLRIDKPFVCKKLLNISSCSEHCLRSYFPNMFYHSEENELSFTQYCDEHLSNRMNVNWTCAARHSFRLLTCLANVSSITTNSVKEDMMNKESCRKSLEFQSCPTQVLSADCGEKTADAIKDMLQFVLDYRMPACKKSNVNEVLSMPVHYHLGYNLMEAAKSFDAQHIYISSCFDQLIQDEIDLDGFLCGDYDSLSDCVTYSISKDGKKYPPIRGLLLKFFSLGNIKCKKSDFELKHVTSFYPEITENVKPSVSDFHIQSDYSSPEISTSDKTDEDLIRVHTEPPVTSTSKKVKNDFKIFNDVSQEKNSDSESVKNTNVSVKVPPSENTQKSNDANYFKTSVAISLFLDKGLFFIIFMLFILR